MKAFIYYEFSYSFSTLPDDAKNSKEKFYGIPTVSTKTGSGREVVFVPDSLTSTEEYNKWIEEYEDKKGREILEDDILHRDDVFVQVKNFCQLS